MKEKSKRANICQRGTEVPHDKLKKPHGSDQSHDPLVLDGVGSIVNAAIVIKVQSQLR